MAALGLIVVEAAMQLVGPLLTRWVIDRAFPAHDAALVVRVALLFAALLLDTSPQPQDTARQLAAAMGARYLPLPHACATLLSQAVRAAGVAGSAPAR